MTKRALNIIIAVAVNLITFTLLCLLFIIEPVHLLPYILVPAAAHIALCTTLLKFLYWDREDID